MRNILRKRMEIDVNMFIFSVRCSQDRPINPAGHRQYPKREVPSTFSSHTPPFRQSPAVHPPAFPIDQKEHSTKTDHFNDIYRSIHSLHQKRLQGKNCTRWYARNFAFTLPFEHQHCMLNPLSAVGTGLHIPPFAQFTYRHISWPI